MATEAGKTTPSPPEAADDEMKRIDIAPDGVLILLVQETLELRVDSFMMSVSSPIFKAMLGPHFAEGQTRGSATNPKEVPLPEDDPEAIRLLCLVFYNEGDLLLEAPPSNDILQLVKAADKYQCLVRVRLAVEAWLSSIRYITYRIDPYPLLHVIYLLDDERRFAEYTEALVGEGVDYIDRWEASDDPVTNKLHKLVKDKAEFIETKLKPPLMDAIENLCDCMAEEYHYRGNLSGMEPPAEELDSDDDEYNSDELEFEFEADGSVPPKCDYTERCIWMHLNSLAKARLWPLKKRHPYLHGFRAHLGSFELARDPSIKPCRRQHSFDTCEDYNNKFEQKFRAAMKELKQEAWELRDFKICLDCYKAGGKYEGRCRTYHIK